MTSDAPPALTRARTLPPPRIALRAPHYHTYCLYRADPTSLPGVLHLACITANVLRTTHTLPHTRHPHRRAAVELNRGARLNDACAARRAYGLSVQWFFLDGTLIAF